MLYIVVKETNSTLHPVVADQLVNDTNFTVKESGCA